MRTMALFFLFGVFLTACTAAAPRRQVPMLIIKYAGANQYAFEGQTYNFRDLTTKIQAEYGDAAVAGMDVDMTGWTTNMDIINICAVHVRTGIPIHAHYMHDGTTSSISC